MRPTINLMIVLRGNKQSKRGDEEDDGEGTFLVKDEKLLCRVLLRLDLFSPSRVPLRKEMDNRASE